MNKNNKIQAMNRFAYYWEGYPYDDASDVIPADDGGQGGGEGGITKEEMDAAIANALQGIHLHKLDDDSFVLQVGDNQYDTTVIDDIYLTDVTTTQDGEGNIMVNFLRSNDQEPISINVDELDNPNLDMKTF